MGEPRRPANHGGGPEPAEDLAEPRAGRPYREPGSTAVRRAELVHEPLGALSFLHDALLVVLADGAAQLVVVHGGPVLALAPQPGHSHRVLDLEHSAWAVQPADAAPVHLRLRQQLLQKLPQVDVG